MSFLGYLDPADTAFDDHGLHPTGDLGSVDERGILSVVGRLKDIIIRKGENISAKEVEDTLIRHPSVVDVAVVGLADEERGERCCAVIVLTTGADGLTVQEVGDHCAAQGLARYKTPEQIELVAALPRNQTGKVLKRTLQRQLNRQSSSGTSSSTSSSPVNSKTRRAAP
jgi:cyclohexanecarboxylate-CoA ligase